MKSIVSLALSRCLTPVDVDSYRTAGNPTTEAVCDSFARELVQRYLDGEVRWANADTTANNLAYLMRRCCAEGLPAHGWQVHFAFDQGVNSRLGGDAITRTLLARLGYASAASTVTAIN